MEKNKLPRNVVMANNKKKSDIKYMLMLRDAMILNNTDKYQIDKFINTQYDKINSEYEQKIKKANNKKSNEKNEIKKINKNKEKSIGFILKNKIFLEDQGASKEYIDKYVEKQYNEVNKYYMDKIQEIKSNQLDFID